ncbi:MAG: hypothetical protein LBE55_05080 [Clostridiales bacterium]|jgi:uncharacterized membrane protein YkvI|nr:hypothetical protein [Clostridiales bacterium]
MDKIKIIKTACVYTGIIFGAGFASGQEHLTFFLRYGRWGVAGIIVAGALIALCGWAVMDICVRQKIENYREFMAVVFGRRLGAALDIVTGAFIFVIFSAMLAATGALGSEAAGLPFSWGVIFAAVLCFVVLLFDLRGMVHVNTAISPILVAGALFLGLYAILGSAQHAFAGQIADNWPTSALIYASYNLIPAVAVLAAMPNLVTTRKIAKWGGVLGGLFLGIIGIVMAFALLSNMQLVGRMQLPMLALAQNFGHLITNFYVIILLLAIYTTAATNAFSLTQWLAARTRLSRMKIKIAIVILGIVAAHVGFSNIVAHAYSFFGFLGLFIMFAIIIYFLTTKSTKIHEKRKRT